MDAPLRALIVEKSRSDIALEVQALEAAGYRVTYTVAVTGAEMKAALAKQTFDIIITDHDLPRFDASEALAVLKQSGLDIPFLIISAAMDEEKAVALLKAGAHDYITKDRLSSLTSNVKNALQNAENRRLIKQAEKALRMSEEKYRMLFANANESIFVAQEGKIVFLNPRMLKLTGYSAEEITGWPFTQLIHPDDSEMVVKRHISRLKGEIVPYSYDFRVVQKNGTVTWVKLSAVLMTWEGKPATLNFLEDITTRKLSDDALRESEEQLKDSLENAPDGIYMSDLEGNFLYGNRRCEEIVGYKREELIGKNFLELNLLPENSLGKALELLVACREGGKSRIEEFELIRKDGGLIPVEINTSMVRMKGQAAVLAFVRDTTERKQAQSALRESENLYRSLVETSPDAIGLMDLKGNIITHNKRALEVFGFDLTEDLVGTNIKDLMAPENYNSIIVNMGKLQKAEVIRNWELPSFKKDGRPFWLEISSSMLFDDEGKPKTIIAVFKDITDRKQAEEKLASFHQQNELILRTVTEGIMGVDLQGNHTFVNAAAAKMLGYEVGELLGRPSHSTWHHTKPDGSPCPKEECSIFASYRDGTIHHISNEVFWRKGGANFPVDYVSSPSYEQGRLVGAVVTFWDVTERKLAENKIKGLAKFPDENPSPVLRIAQDGTIMYANRASQILLNQWHRSIGQRLPDHWQQLVEAAVNSGLSNTFEYACESHVFSLIIAPIVTEKYANIYCLDITERKLAEGKIKESEEKYRSIVENSSDQIFMMDKDFKLLALNAAAAGLVQKTPQEIVGKSLFDVFPEKYAERFSKQIKTVFETGRSLAIEDKLTLLGGERYNSVTINPIQDEKGRVIAVTGIVRDITDLRQAEEVKAARMIAEAANLAKSDFLSNMSHELRTPLNSIIGFSEVLFDQTFGPLNETQKDYLNDVMTSGQHLLSLINDILDLSKVEAGKMQLALSTFSLRQLLEESFVLIKEKTLKHNINFSSEIADEVGEVRADERQIKQIVYNLLSNAVKFTPDGGRAGIRARKDAEQIEVSVWDTGIGLAAEDQNKLFEKFTQIGNIYTGKRAGTGLGLSLVKSMVELHGGKVWVESGGMGKGSTFTFTLPIRQKVDGEVRIDRGLK